METSLSGVLTHLFDRLSDGDDLLVNQDLLCLECVRDILSGDSTEDFAVLVSFNFYFDYGLSQFSLQSLRVSENLGSLVSLLFEVLGELFLIALVSDDSNLLREQVVTSVAVAYFNDVVLETEVCKVLNQNYFFSRFTRTIISSCLLRKAAEPSGVLS